MAQKPINYGSKDLIEIKKRITDEKFVPTGKTLTGWITDGSKTAIPDRVLTSEKLSVIEKCCVLYLGTFSTVEEAIDDAFETDRFDELMVGIHAWDYLESGGDGIGSIGVWSLAGQLVRAYVQRLAVE